MWVFLFFSSCLYTTFGQLKKECREHIAHRLVWWTAMLDLEGSPWRRMGKNAVSSGDTQPERRWVFSVESENHVKSQSYLPPRDTVLTSSIPPTVVSSSSATLKSSWRPYVRALAQKKWFRVSLNGLLKFGNWQFQTFHAAVWETTTATTFSPFICMTGWFHQRQSFTNLHTEKTQSGIRRRHGRS